MLPFKTLVVLTIVAATLAGCGKSNAAPPKNRFEEDNPDAWLERLRSGLDSIFSQEGVKQALDLPSGVKRALKEQTSNLTPFKLHPFQATLEGMTVVGGNTLPAQIELSLTKKCTWIFESRLSAFIAGEDSLIRLDFFNLSEERLDGFSSSNLALTATASVEDLQSSNEKIISTERSIELIKKNREGFTIEFKEPAKHAQQSPVPALLQFEAEQLRLELIEQGRREFTYRQVDSSAQTLYTEEATKVSLRRTEKSLPLKLWEIATDSYETVDGEPKITVRFFGILTSNSFPVFLSYDFEDMKIEGWLTDFSVLQPEACSEE